MRNQIFSQEYTQPLVVGRLLLARSAWYGATLPPLKSAATLTRLYEGPSSSWLTPPIPCFSTQWNA